MTGTKLKVLVVEDDRASREGLASLLESWGYDVTAVSDGKSALKAVEGASPHVIVTDLMMPGMTGIGLLKSLGESLRELPVIVLTGHATIETAVEAMKFGAYDYLTKPLQPDRLQPLLGRAIEHASLAREASALRERLESPLGSYGLLVGKSPPLRQLYKRLTQVAPTTAPVLVSGESGTGKELVARTLHDLSPRREGPFLPLNCAAIPPSLMESEIFGHEKGAFTGAIARQQGCFERAHGGTLFLDEVTEMPPEMQAKLLRVLEEGKVRRIGSGTEIAVTVRVVAATNRNPSLAVKDGCLRADLFYRLSVFHLELPPLRERGDDILILARYFLDECCSKLGRPVPQWNPDFAPSLLAHSWPGNVRELSNAMERLSVLAPGPVLTAFAFQQLCVAASSHGIHPELSLSLAEAERQVIERALAATQGNKTRAARLLGITPKTLYAKLASYTGGKSTTKSP
jgi:DNA-binding NtrC family response regulator